MAGAIISPDTSRNDLLKVAGAGVLSGLLTPLMVPLIDGIAGTPGDFRIALVAIPFAVLVFILVRKFAANPWWAAWIAAIVTIIAFVAAVNAAIFVDVQAGNAAKAVLKRSIGLAGGLSAPPGGARHRAAPAGPRDAAAWLRCRRPAPSPARCCARQCARPRSDSVLYPVWQAGVAAAGALAAAETFLKIVRWSAAPIQKSKNSMSQAASFQLITLRGVSAKIAF